MMEPMPILQPPEVDEHICPCPEPFDYERSYKVREGSLWRCHQCRQWWVYKWTSYDGFGWYRISDRKASRIQRKWAKREPHILKQRDVE